MLKIIYHNDHVEIQENKNPISGFYPIMETTIRAYKLSDIPEEYYDNKLTEEEVYSIYYFFFDLETLMEENNSKDEFEIKSQMIQNSNEYEDFQNGK